MNEKIPKIDLCEFHVIKATGRQRIGSRYLVKSQTTDKKFSAFVFSNFIDQTQFFSQLEINKTINCPSILKILGYSLSDFNGNQFPTIITEYIRDESLEDIFNKLQCFSKLNNTQRYIIAYGIAYFLQFLHSKNLIFKELCPSRIFLDDNYYPRILFFDDIEKEINENIFKTFDLAFVVPEVIDDLVFTEESDSFAYSVLLYMLLTNQKPINKCGRLHTFTTYESISTDGFDNELVTFFENNLDLNSSVRLEFSEILEMLNTKSIQHEFGDINEEEIDNFLTILKENEDEDDKSENEVNSMSEDEKSYSEYERDKIDSDSEKDIINSDCERRTDSDDEKETKNFDYEIDKTDSGDETSENSETVSNDILANENSKLIEENKKLTNELNLLKNKFEESRIKKIRDFQILEVLGLGPTTEVLKVLRSDIFVLKIFKSDYFKSDFDESEAKKAILKWDDDDIQEPINIDNERVTNLFDLYKKLNVLNHPNIIKSIDFFNGDETNYPSILFEYYPRNLKNSINRLDNNDLCAIIYEICKAMETLHENDLAHFNLKPENILLDSNKHVKLTDFRVTSEIKGRYLEYYPPEVLKDLEIRGSKADVYSFGILLIFILTRGYLPQFSLTDIIHNFNYLIIPDEINQFSSQLIECCCSTEPGDRPSFSDLIFLIKENNFQLIDDVDQEIIRDHLSI